MIFRNVRNVRILSSHAGEFRKGAKPGITAENIPYIPDIPDFRDNPLFERGR